MRNENFHYLKPEPNTLQLKTTIISLLFPLLLTLSITTTAQTFRFPTQNAKWCYGEYYDDGSPGPNFCLEFQDQEVIINDIIYSPLLRINNSSIDTIAFMREENNRVYNLPARDSTSEYIIYDFNLEVGDVFEVNWSYFEGNLKTYKLEVISIEEYESEPGSFRKRWILTDDQEGVYVQWLEGIGDDIWLFHQPAYIFSVSGGFSFLCQIIEGAIQDGQTSNYCLSVDNKNTDIENDIHISPNPFSDQIAITSPDYKITSIQLFRINGQLIKSIELPAASSRCQLTTSQLSAGMYFLKVEDENANVSIKKLIKQ